MNQLLTFLENNPWLNLLFLSLAIISIIVSIVLFFKSKKDKIPVYNMVSFNLVKDQLSKLEGIQITYHGQTINNLTSTKIAFWNKGREIINHYDMAEKDPLRLEVTPPHQILQAEIVYSKKTANNFSVELDQENQCVYINFDYFHTNEGVVTQIYHTALSSKDVKLLGTIKGVNEIKNSVIPEDYLVDKILVPILRKVIPRSGSGRIILLIILSMPLGIILIFLQILETVLRFFNVIPKEYSLKIGD